MNAKLKLITFTILIFISFSVLGQNREGEQTKDTMVSLLQNIDDEYTLILMVTDEYIIKTSYTIFENNLNMWLLENPHITDDKDLFEIVKNAKNKEFIINVEKILKEKEEDHGLEKRLRYRIAYLLEEGKCLIIDKKNNKPISKIKVQTYIFNCGPLCGDGGRRFFIENIMFFGVMDWIS